MSGSWIGWMVWHRRHSKIAPVRPLVEGVARETKVCVPSGLVDHPLAVMFMVVGEATVTNKPGKLVLSKFNWRSGQLRVVTRHAPALVGSTGNVFWQVHLRVPDAVCSFG